MFLNDILEYDLIDVVINFFRRAMGNVAEALHHMEKCLPGRFVECAAALKNTLRQFFYLEIHLPV